MLNITDMDGAVVCLQLWHPNIVAQPGGAERSAELVIALTGSEDPTEQLMQLVFGGSQGELLRWML